MSNKFATLEAQVRQLASTTDWNKNYIHTNGQVCQKKFFGRLVNLFICGGFYKVLEPAAEKSQKAVSELFKKFLEEKNEKLAIEERKKLVTVAATNFNNYINKQGVTVYNPANSKENLLLIKTDVLFAAFPVQKPQESEVGKTEAVKNDAVPKEVTPSTQVEAPKEATTPEAVKATTDATAEKAAEAPVAKANKKESEAPVVESSKKEKESTVDENPETILAALLNKKISPSEERPRADIPATPVTSGLATTPSEVTAGGDRFHGMTRNDRHVELVVTKKRYITRSQKKNSSATAVQ